MAINTETVATRLAERLAEFGVALTDAEGFATAFAGDLVEWVGGAEAVPVALASKVTTTAGAWNTDVMQRIDWWTGEVDGGPNGDGLYPMTNAAGVTTLFPSLAKILDSTAKGNAGWSAKTMVEADGPTRAVVRIVEWVGGQGAKPATGYVAADGSLVGTAAGGYDFFGPLSTALAALKTGAETARTGAEAARDLVSFGFELGVTRYAYGKRVLAASMDNLQRGGWITTEDGYTYAKYATKVGVSNGLVKTTGADGFESWSLGTVEGELPLGVEGAVMSTGRTYYIGGMAVRAAVMAANGGLGWALMADGTFKAKLDITGGGVSNGLSITSTSTGGIAISLGTKEGELPLGGGSYMVSTKTYYRSGKRVSRAMSDASNRFSWVEYEDGTVEIPSLISPSLDAAGGAAALETAAYVFEVATDGAGKQQVFRTLKATGQRVQVTSSGNNFAPRLSFDGSKIVYLTDRNGKKESYYQLLGGSVFGGSIEHPVQPILTLIEGLGDSIMATGWIDPVAAYFGVTLAAPSSSPGGGIGSQRSTQIAYRYGAGGFAGLPELTCSLTGNTMTAGANQLTALSNPFLSRAGDAAGYVRSLRARILGIKGVITSTQKASADGTTIPPTLGVDNYTYTFTPDDGQTLPGVVPAGSVLVVDPENRQDVPLFFHIGRNDVGTGAGWQDTVKTCVAAIMAAYKPMGRKIGFGGITNARSEPSGSANYNAIVAYNADIAALYPDNFLDFRPYFNAGEATDIPNAAYTAPEDGLHPNTAGKLNGFTNPAKAWMISKGWFS